MSDEHTLPRSEVRSKTAKAPSITDDDEGQRMAALLETLEAVETLEYHNQLWLALDPATRSREKRALLAEALLLSGHRTNVADFT